MFRRKKQTSPQQGSNPKPASKTSGAVRPKLSLLSLESRLMFDAAAAATAAEVNQEQVAQEQAESAVSSDNTPGSESQASIESQELLQAITTYSPGETPTEVAFVDPTVPDYQSLIAGMGPNVQIVMLDGGQDGMEQIAASLAGRTGIDAIHIISHGAEGQLSLGTGTLTQESMTGQYADELAAIRQSLSESADILVYGCDFAEGQAGQDATTLLSQLTGADVAASTDDTGYAGLGGDWDLELQTGTIETQVAIDYDTQADWLGLLSLTASGGETRVNTTTTGIQTHNSLDNAYTPDSVAMDASGNYVSVWESAGNVYGQRYNSAGTAQGSEFVITSNAANERLASVAMNSSGAFVVTWERNQGTGDYDIYARMYNSSGTAIGSEFLVNETTTYDQEQAKVAMDANGNFVVVWESNHEAGTYYDNIYAQRYDATGIKIGSNFQVNTTTAGDQDYADIAMDSSGNFVVVWEGERTAGSSVYSIYGQRYNSAGVVQGGEFLVNATASNNDQHASVAMNDSGNFVVTWDRQSGSDSDIQAQRFNSSGVAQGGAISVTNTTSYWQDIANVSMDGGGNFVVSWSSDGQDGSGFGIYSRQYDPTGTALTTESRAATTTSGAQDFSGIAYQNGKVVVTWSGNGTGDSSGIFMQRYNAAGGNAAPTVTSNGGGLTAAISVAENTTAVTTVTATDADVGATLTYSISGGSDAAKFTINSSTGALSFITAPNYESPTDSGGNNVYDVLVTVTDTNGGADTQSIAVTVTNTNENPTDLSLSANTVAENAANGTVIGTVTGTDPDSGDTKTYSFTDSAGGRFALDSATGVMTVANGSLLNYEAAPSHSVTVRVTDSGGLTYDETFTINLTNVNEAPTGADATVTLTEDTAQALTAATFGFSDVDAGDSLSAVRLDSLPSAGSLTLSGVAVTAGQVVSVADLTAGNLVFTPAANANGTGYTSLTFSVRDSNNAYDATPNTLTVDVTAANDAPTLTANTGSTVAEGGTDTIDSSELAVTDVDNNSAEMTYSIGTGPAYGRLELTTAPGVSATTFTQADIAANRLIYVHDGSETASDSFTFTVGDGAGGTLGTTTMTLTITPVNDTPTITSDGGASTAVVNVAENVSAVTIVTGADVDLPAQALTYSISGGTDQARFTINIATGALNFTAPPNFEAATDANGDNVYVVQVQVVDSQGASTTQTIQVTVTDVAEGLPPTPTPPPVLLPTTAPSPTGPGPVSSSPAGPPVQTTDVPLPVPLGSGPSASPPEFPPTGAVPSEPERLNPIRPEEPRKTSDVAKDSVLFHWIDETRSLLLTGMPVEATPTPESEPAEQSQSVSDLLFSKLDEMTASLEQAMGVSQEQHAVTVRIAALTGTTLSSGFIAWALRSGTLLASCLATMPTWRHFDPLPVLGGSRSERERRRKEAERDRRAEATEFKGLKHLLDLEPPPDPKP